MAWNDANYFRSLGLHIEFNSHRVDGVIGTGGFGAGGSVNETSATQINSTFQEFSPGITDGGVMQVQANAPLQSPVYEELRSSNVNGETRSLNVWIGGVPSGSKNVDGLGFVVNENVPILTAGTDSIIVSTTAVARGISVGDFVALQSETDYSDTDHVGRITALSATGSNLTVTFTDGDDVDSALSGANVKIIRPAILVAQSAYVAQFEHRGETDGIIMLDVAFRKSGQAYHYVGNNDGEGSTPTLPNLTTPPTSTQRF